MSQLILPGNAIPGHVLSGENFSAGLNYNIPGTMPNNGALNFNPSTASQPIPSGFTTGGAVNPVTGSAAVGDVANGAGFSSANGIGLIGTGANVKRKAIGNKAYGTYTVLTQTTVTVTGLTFQPSQVIIRLSGNTAVFGGQVYPNGALLDINKDGSNNFSTFTYNATGFTFNFYFTTNYGSISFDWEAIE